MLTKKGKYALKAMLHLAKLREDEIDQVDQIAKANNISKKFLDQILADLRNVGLVQSTKGRSGGYALAKPADEIKVGQIIRAIDGPIAPFLCASVTGYRPCDDCDEEECAVRQLMIEARNAMSSVLDTQTLADMLASRYVKKVSSARTRSAKIRTSAS
jgi:Rrf2 family protein